MGKKLWLAAMLLISSPLAIAVLLDRGITWLISRREKDEPTHPTPEENADADDGEA